MTPRIAYMTGEYPRATDTFIQREVAALRRLGAHVETFSVRQPPAAEEVGPEQRAERTGTYYLLPPCAVELFKAHAGFLAKSPVRYLRALLLAIRLRPPGMKALGRQAAYFGEAGLVARRMLKHSLQHLHNHFSDSSCWVAMLASIMGGFTFSFTMHGPGEFFETMRWRLDEKIRRALFVCCISDFCRSQGMIFGPPENWDRMLVVHCGVDPEHFQPIQHQGRGSRVLFVGRLARPKGVPILLDAIAKLRESHPDVRLSIVGDGPDRQQLESTARTLGVESQVRFLGYQSQSQVRELLKQSDVFAMASFAEGIPVVLMEAMASGVPVVATRIAGIPELVEDGRSGFLVSPGDSAALAHRIGQLLDDPDLRTTFAAPARLKIERDFNLRIESERLWLVLTAALAGQVLPVRPQVGSPTFPPAGRD